MTRGGWATWRWPLAIGLVTFVGLLAALLIDGRIGVVAGWIGLGCPTLLLVARITMDLARRR
jgi:hypothetical protein